MKDIRKPKYKIAESGDKWVELLKQVKNEPEWATNVINHLKKEINSLQSQISDLRRYNQIHHGVYGTKL